VAPHLHLLLLPALLQCFTQAGYGRVSTRGSDGKVSLTAVLCPIGTYNVGANTAGCQKCGAGLTTAAEGSTAATDCSEWRCCLI
jgi:hypothetical protein